MNIPVLSDMTKQISRDYGVLLEGEGVALRYGAVKASGIVAGRAHGTDAARRLPARACPALPAASSSLTPRACCARSPSTTCRSAAPSTRPSASSRPSSTPTATARVWQCPEGGGHCSVWVRPDTHSPAVSPPPDTQSARRAGSPAARRCGGPLPGARQRTARANAPPRCVCSLGARRSSRTRRTSSSTSRMSRTSAKGPARAPPRLCTTLEPHGLRVLRVRAPRLRLARRATDRHYTLALRHRL